MSAPTTTTDSLATSTLSSYSRFRIALKGLVAPALLAASMIAALNFTTMYAVAQNATSGKNTTDVSNMTGSNTTSSSSCGSGSKASSRYDTGYQNALANPGKTCPSGHSYNYCAG